MGSRRTVQANIAIQKNKQIPQLEIDTTQNQSVIKESTTDHQEDPVAQTNTNQ